MNISARCAYACRAAVELAHHEHAAVPVTVQAIAERCTIPEKYLVHVLLQLKRAGLVRSVRGAQGGYLLAHSSESISLFDLVKAVDGPVLYPIPGEGSGGTGLEMTWRYVAAEIEAVLRGVTLRSIAEGARRAAMYYI